jgi:hypothetical protein
MPDPVIRYAPIGQLVVYEVSEKELDDLARGGDSSLELNFGVALLSIAVTVLFTYLTVPLDGKIFTVFVCAGLITAISGLYLTVRGLRQYKSTAQIVKTIKERDLLPEGIQESPPIDLVELLKRAEQARIGQQS